MFTPLAATGDRKHEEHNMKLEINNKLHLHGAPEKLTAQLCATFTLPNPELIAARKAGRYTGNLPPTLRFYGRTNGPLTLPSSLSDFLSARW